jgi:hypothetical protein
MGRYINIIEGKALGSSFDSKIKVLAEAGAMPVGVPTEWREGLIVVVDNGNFAAAAYAYSEEEMNHFITGKGGRPWLWMEYADAKQYADG